MSHDFVDVVNDNTVTIISFSLLGWALLFQLMINVFKVNILKIVVLIGTFALAMAFAGTVISPSLLTFAADAIDMEISKFVEETRSLFLAAFK